MQRTPDSVSVSIAVTIFPAQLMEFRKNIAPCQRPFSTQIEMRRGTGKLLIPHPTDNFVPVIIEYISIAYGALSSPKLERSL